MRHEQAVRFFRAATGTNAIVYHGGCTDGICSAALATELLEDYGNSAHFIYGLREPRLSTRSYQTIMRREPTQAFILDLDVHRDPVRVIQMATEDNVLTLLVDHHGYHRRGCDEGVGKPADLGQLSSNIIDEHSARWRVSQRAEHCTTSWMIYQMAREAGKEGEDKAWKAVVGLEGDASASAHPWLQRNVYKRYEQYDITTLADAITLAADVPNIVRKVAAAERPRDLLEDEMLSARYIEQLQQRDRLVRKFRKVKRRRGWPVFYEIEAETLFTSHVADRLARKYHGTTILVTQKRGNKVNVSARSNSYDMQMLLQQSTNDICIGRPGGHARRAGGTIRADRYEDFQKLFTFYYRQAVRQSQRI
jgi:single-stranded DNA-specific DHH superfamily exonuclease